MSYELQAWNLAQRVLCRPEMVHGVGALGLLQSAYFSGSLGMSTRPLGASSTRNTARVGQEQ